MFALLLACAEHDPDKPRRARDDADTAADTADPGDSGAGDSGAGDSGPGDTADGDSGDPDSGAFGDTAADSGGGDTSALDADRDGYSDDDCDDADPSVHPGAAEICRDGVDQDCDGVDRACLTGEVSVGDPVVIEDTADSALVIEVVGDVDGDGVGGLFLASYREGTGDLYAGSAWHFSGTIRDTRYASEAPVALYGERESDAFGYAIADAGDADGDGLSDLLVGAPGVRSAAFDAGEAYLFAGVEDGAWGAREATATFQGEEEGDRAGTSVRSAGDTDGDGLADLLVTATPSGLHDPNQARVYLLRCPCAGTTSLSDADVRWDADGWLEEALHAADLTGDGLPEIVVFDAGEEALLVIPAAGDGDRTMADDATARVYGTATDDWARPSVAAGDLDGDGVTDLVWGSPSYTAGRYHEGFVMVQAGPVSGTRLSYDAVATVRGEAAYAAIAADLGVGDLDGDGADDLVVTRPWPHDDGRGVGGLLGLYGPLSGEYTRSGADVLFLGEGQELGSEVAVGDLDGDGFADVVAGAVREADHAAYVVRGGPR